MLTQLKRYITHKGLQKCGAIALCHIVADTKTQQDLGATMDKVQPIISAQGRAGEASTRERESRRCTR